MKKIEPKISDAQYSQALRQALRFKSLLSGDAGCVDPEVNRACLEAMITGWITAQSWFKKLKVGVERSYPRENIYLIVQDWSTEITHDVVDNSDERFNERKHRKFFGVRAAEFQN
jgi:hypothetical protein